MGFIVVLYFHLYNCTHTHTHTHTQTANRAHHPDDALRLLRLLHGLRGALLRRLWKAHQKGQLRWLLHRHLCSDSLLRLAWNRDLLPRPTRPRAIVQQYLSKLCLLHGLPLHLSLCVSHLVHHRMPVASAQIVHPEGQEVQGSPSLNLVHC